MAAGQRLTDLKADIFANIAKFMEEIQQQESQRSESTVLLSGSDPIEHYYPGFRME